MDAASIERRFTYHAPRGNQPARYERIRIMARQYAELIDALCPDSDEKSRAIDRLDEVVMLANAAIARNE